MFVKNCICIWNVVDFKKVILFLKDICMKYRKGIAFAGWLVTWFLLGYTVVRKNVRLLFNNDVLNESK